MLHARSQNRFWAMRGETDHLVGPKIMSGGGMPFVHLSLSELVQIYFQGKVWFGVFFLNSNAVGPQKLAPLLNVFRRRRGGGGLFKKHFF